MIGIFLKLKKIKELNDYKKFFNSSFAMEDGITKNAEDLSLRLFNKKLYELTDDELVQLINKIRRNHGQQRIKTLWCPRNEMGCKKVSK